MKRCHHIWLKWLFIGIIWVSCNDNRQQEVSPGTIPSAKPAILELIADSINDQSVGQLKAVLQEQGIDQPLLYQWKNHIVLLDSLPGTRDLVTALQDTFSGWIIKLYSDLFYQFSRDSCKVPAPVMEREHILLTANLVPDTLLQREYLAYHAQQYEQWPEVARGFCNAGFQQLLLFRNGRQLMLVISIPKGESLDKLNPKTTENNPRVNEWNNLMRKYQQGIEGTEEGEVWVFLKPVV